MRLTSFAVRVAVGFGGACKAGLYNKFMTAGTPGCGQSTCCEPSCQIYWKDNRGCKGEAESAGNCLMTFSDKEETDDTGVDICDGAGMFLCETGHGRVIYVINTAREVSAAHVPKPKVCTLSGQCAPCDAQDFCGPPVYIGNAASDGHNCKKLNAKLAQAQNHPARCS